LSKELTTETQVVEVGNIIVATCDIPVKDLAGYVESVLFLSGDGVASSYLSEKFNCNIKDVEDALFCLQQKYGGKCGIHLIKYRNKWQLATNPSYAEKVAEVLNPIREKNLTRAILEALAIVAYKQPITRLDVDEVRGVDSTYAMQVLTQNNLIEVVGRKDTIGKPLLYATTDEFLKRFDLENIDKLPSYDELLEKIKIIQNGDDLYNSNREQA